MNLPRTLRVALGFGLMLGMVSANACRSDFTSECPAGQEDCPCVDGSGGTCLEGLSCVSNTCVDLSNVDTSDTQQSGEETASGEASTTQGDGDGDSSTGDGDGDATTGDGDGDATTGDGDGDATTGDGDGDATTGDGDGDATTGDGDGDATTGDGDGDATTGDGDGDATTGDGDGDGDGTTGDGDGDGDACGLGEVCMPDAPGGWQGPVIVRVASGNAPVCPAQFPIAASAGQAMDDFAPGNWTCGCQCGDVSGATCAGDGSVQIDSSCSSSSTPVALDPTCSAVDAGGGTLAVIPVPDPVDLSAATCGAGSVNESAGTPSFNRNVDACTGGTGSSCNGSGTCLPEGVGVFDQVCYYAAGNVPCPSGLTDRSVYYTGSNDSRDCPTTCGCEPPASADCPMLLSIYDGSCTTPNLLANLVDSCFGPVNFSGSVRVNNIAGGTGTIGCDPEQTNIQPTGAATATGPITYCCL